MGPYIFKGLSPWHLSKLQVAHPDFLSKAMATKAVKKEAAKKESVTWSIMGINMVVSEIFLVFALDPCGNDPI